MAIETENPINEEVEVEEEAVVQLPPEEGEEITEEPEQDFYANIAETIDDKALSQLASDLITEYQSDKQSRKEWEDTYRNGLDLLGFKYKSTTQPFKGASNVTHPLLSEAVTQFQAQAYKELLPSDGPVKTKIVGLQNEAVEAQAQRVKDFMNFQIMEKMEEYTPEFDQLLFYLPLAGSAFKKIYYDALMERAVSKFIPAEDLVVPYFATDLKDAPRITHVLKQSENDLLKKMATGFYREVELMKPEKKENKIQDKYNELEGVKPVETNDYIYNVLEMHVDLDLSDYIAENEEDKINIKIPYIVTIEESTRKVLSIYRNYKPEDTKFTRREYFSHYKFLPGLGFYGFGLIHMIGGLSRTATTALRQLLDAGTLSNLPAGFKSRGMRIRDDDQPIQPGEFRDVDAPGGNIRDQFQLLPFKEPSTTLLERGSRVMSAIHKRCYYAMKQEFKLLGKVIADYLPPEYPYAVYGAERMIKLMDFDDRIDILPVADPNIFSMSQRVTLAQTQLQIAQSNPQMHNVHEAYRRVYAALGTKDINTLLKKPEEPEPKDPAMENAAALRMEIPQAFEDQNHDAHIFSHMAFMRTRMVQMNPAVYALLQAHVSEHISFKARAQAVILIQQEQPEVLQLQDTDPEAFQQLFEGIVAERIQLLTEELVAQEQPSDDPLVRLKQQELDLRAMDMQRRGEEFVAQEQRKASEFDQRIDLEKMEREDSEEAGKERIRVADDKLDIMRDKLKQDTSKGDK